MEIKESPICLQSANYGKSKIHFSLHYSSRSTLAIHVYPNCAVVVDAPHKTAYEKIEEKIIKRARWILRQQAMFDGLPISIPARKYVSGETFRYLGRQYRLKIELGLINKVILQKGRLFVFVTINTPDRVKGLIDKWYNERAEILFAERLKICQEQAQKAKIHYKEKLHIRVMKNRWGSCTKNGQLILNPELVAASKDCIDYVITHELCHTKEHNHGKKFYNLLTYVMPDWKYRRDKLNGTVETKEV